MFGSHWKWGCRSIFFDMKSFHTDVERYPHNMKWGRKTHGGLAGFSKYPRKNECVWGSTETGLDRATPKHGLWLLLTGMLPSGFYFINFCLVWIFITDKLKSGKITEMFPFFFFTHQVSFSENSKLKFPGTLNSEDWSEPWKSEMKWWWLGWEKSLEICGTNLLPRK